MSSASRSIVIASRSRAEDHGPAAATHAASGAGPSPATADSSARWQIRSG